MLQQGQLPAHCDDPPEVVVFGTMLLTHAHEVAEGIQNRVERVLLDHSLVGLALCLRLETVELKDLLHPSWLERLRIRAETEEFIAELRTQFRR